MNWINKKKLKNYFLLYFYTQLIVTIVSLPILVSWGIPISIMSSVGNLIFSPVMAMFLAVSSFIFLTEILGIPNQILISFLEYITELLYWMLSFGSKSWLVGFRKPNSFLLFLMLVIFVALHFIFIRSKLQKRTIIFVIFLICCIGILKFNMFNQTLLPSAEILNNKLKISLDENNNLEIEDNGGLNRYGSENFIKFDLKPFLIKKFGTITIEKLILNNPSIRNMIATIALCNYTNLKKIEIFDFKSDKFQKIKAYFIELQNLAKDKNIKLVVHDLEECLL